MRSTQLEHSLTAVRHTLSFVFLAVGMFVALSAAWADPPPWAPAHGWRKKYDPHYVGYEGRRWPSDYGVLRGSCNREAIGAVLGAAVGGAIGSRVGHDDQRAVATVVGVVLGAVIGAQIGRTMDEEDRACMGHALELSEAGRPVYWENERSGADYVLIPLSETTVRGYLICRDFELEVRFAGKRDVSKQKACRNDNGSWSLARR